MAGRLFMHEARAAGAVLLPIDSEHNAVFQCLPTDAFGRAAMSEVRRIVLTASGGPFRTASPEKLRSVTPDEACAHPNWVMGRKISVDSATMMNKGLEVIEAYHLFPIRKDQIDIVIHPESIIHSMVSFIDGSVLAQMGAPDMCTPISYALAYPERVSTESARLDLAKIGSLNFYAPDNTRFPALALARAALETDGTAPCILNAANEIAVEAFLKKQIRFTDITKIIQATLEKLPSSTPHNIEDVLDADRAARHTATHIITQHFS